MQTWEPCGGCLPSFYRLVLNVYALFQPLCTERVVTTNRTLWRPSQGREGVGVVKIGRHTGKKIRAWHSKSSLLNNKPPCVIAYDATPPSLHIPCLRTIVLSTRGRVYSPFLGLGLDCVTCLGQWDAREAFDLFVWWSHAALVSDLVVRGRNPS